MSTSVHNVAAYILKKKGSMSAMKLQKLVYYSQAWSLVWDEKPLFTAEIQAWANGPVIPALYKEHKGEFRVSQWPKGDPSKLTKIQKESIDGVLKFYGEKTAQWLSDLTHQEAPWINARKGLADLQRSNSVITDAALHEYYTAL